MSRSELDINNVFRKKKSDAMSRRHFRAEELYENVKIYKDVTDKKLWIVPSFSLLGEMYKVRRLSITHHECDMYCSECEACVHELSCDCPDATSNSSFCKHMHVLCLNDYPEDFFYDSSGRSKSLKTTNDKNQGTTAKSIFSNFRRGIDIECLRQEAKAAADELVSVFDQFTSDETYKEIIQTMKNLKSKIEAIENHGRSVSPDIDPCT